MKIIDASSGDIIQKIKFDSSLSNIISLVAGEAKASPTSSSVINVDLLFSDLNEKSQRVSKIYKYVHQYTPKSISYALDTKNISEVIEEHLQPSTLSVYSGDQNLSLISQECKYFQDYYLPKGKQVKYKAI